MAPTLQPFDIPRPAHAKKGQTASVPATMPVPVLQPLDIPRSVHAKPAPAPAPTLQPFDILRPVHAKKGIVPSPVKKDKAVQPTVPAQARPVQQPTQTGDPVHLFTLILGVKNILRTHNFLFAPTFISLEAMKWWLSKDGCASHGCILSTKEQVQREVKEGLLHDCFCNVPGKIEEDFATCLLEKHRGREPGVRVKGVDVWVDDRACGGDKEGRLEDTENESAKSDGEKRDFSNKEMVA
ncbi:hypothetical protein BKA65DRAFT_581055 [Rhexocercosporidium sp. MPI-PUGE-AT-0058]|nr:hypothetical protein BKA65DRAFT_581055 [Rhexocercosporidium sp. MPI-PUGE-AT-0058]